MAQANGICVTALYTSLGTNPTLVEYLQTAPPELPAGLAPISIIDVLAAVYAEPGLLEVETGARPEPALTLAEALAPVTPVSPVPAPVPVPLTELAERIERMAPADSADGDKVVPWAFGLTGAGYGFLLMVPAGGECPFLLFCFIELAAILCVLTGLILPRRQPNSWALLLVALLVHPLSLLAIVGLILGIFSTYRC